MVIREVDHKMSIEDSNLLSTTDSREPQPRTGCSAERLPLLAKTTSLICLRDNHQALNALLAAFNAGDKNTPERLPVGVKADRFVKPTSHYHLC